MITSATSVYALVDFYNMHVSGDKRIRGHIDRATAERLVNDLMDAQEAKHASASDSQADNIAA